MFQDKHVVITGGSSGLGLELARQLVAQGAKLSLVARSESKLDQAASNLHQLQPAARVVVQSLDVRSEESARAGMQQLVLANGDIDIMINSAGILREGPFQSLPMNDFREVMETNYFGLLIATRAALPSLLKTRGRLVNIASMAGLTGAFGYTSYCASKHAIVGLSEALRYELKPKGIIVQLVCPGEFDSPMVDALERTRSPENRAHALTIPKLSVTSVAAATLAGISSNRFLIVPGTLTRWTALALRYFPSLARYLGDATIARIQTQA